MELCSKSVFSHPKAAPAFVLVSSSLILHYLFLFSTRPVFNIFIFLFPCLFNDINDQTYIHLKSTCRRIVAQ